jgi:hemerythrin-like domain-containing protein
MMDIKIPRALVEDHEEMFFRLQEAVDSGGKVGEAARKLLAVMKPHAENEEKFALPPLGLLPALINGGAEFEMADAVMLTETLRDEMPRMLSEHKAILDEVDQLADAARQEGKLQFLDLSTMMKRHVEEEEQVYYPAAELVGAFLKVKLAVVFARTFP